MRRIALAQGREDLLHLISHGIPSLPIHDQLLTDTQAAHIRQRNRALRDRALRTIPTLYPNVCTPILYPNPLSQPSIPTRYPNPLSQPSLQTLYPTHLSKPSI